MEFGKITVRYLGRSDQVEMIIIDKFQYLFISGKHSVQILRSCPFVRAEIDCQSNHRENPVGFIESRQEFRPRFWHFITRFVRFGCIFYLGNILNRVIQHIPHGHSIVNFRLVFYA